MQTQHVNETYSDPTTVILSASAAAGYTIANTFYKIDNGSQQTYTIPFDVSGAGDHTISYWSVDNSGVTEAPNNKPFTIATPTPTPTSTPTATPTPPTPSVQLTEFSPAKVWIGLKNSDDVGVKFDLLVEAYKDSILISSGQLNSFTGGSSGFNNAHLATIPFDSFSPVDFPTGSQLSIKVLVRNACAGSTHNSGVARLWYNDSAADSRFDATINSNNRDYYLRDLFALSNTAGLVPKKTIDIQSGTKCSSFKAFGTWTITP